MAKYLLTCACGRAHTVETRQAGESFVCDCGATVAVPTLRRLRELPQARDETAAVAAPVWGLRQRAITLCLLVAAVCLAIAGFSRISEQPVPTLDAAKYAQNVDRLVGSLSPVQAWQRWIDTYQPLETTGFDVFKHPAADAMQTNLDWHRWIRWVALALAAVFALVAAMLGLAGGKQRTIG